MKDILGASGAGTGIEKGAVQRYLVGFFVSAAMTLASYFAVTLGLFDGPLLIGFIMVMAFAQLSVQLIYFLHLGRETRPRWNLVMFLFMTVILVIIIVGSLWIMDNLNYRMMSPEMLKQFMSENEGL